MAFDGLRQRLKQWFGRGEVDDAHRPDGGTSYYRPLGRKDARRQDSAAQPEPVGNVPYVHTGFTGMNPPADSFVSPGYGFQGNQTGSQGGVRDNISYMPGVMPQTGSPSYAHVEHIMPLTSLKACYEAIECMKNGETLILTLDTISNEGESMRCQDMLAGAAFTLGCSVRILQGGMLVIIAPENVKILPEQQADRMNPPMSFAAYTQAVPSEPAEPVYTGRRERRSSQRAAQWTAARNGEIEGYNPYTGTMPAAAGDYQRYGGYGNW